MPGVASLGRRTAVRWFGCLPLYVAVWGHAGIMMLLHRSRAIPTPIWVASAFTAAFTTAFTIFLIIHPGSESFVTAVDNYATIAGPLLLLPFALGLLRYRWGRSPEWVLLGSKPVRNWAATLLALGVLTDTLGQTIWTFYAQVLNQPIPFPSLDDAAYLCTYPLLLIGILLLSKGPTSLTMRSRLTVDGAVIMVTAFIFSWYFVLGPTVLQGGESLLAKAVGTAYPSADLLLLGALVLLLSRAPDGPRRSIATVLVVGLTGMIVADTIFDFQTLHGTYRTGELVDVLWPLSDMLIAIAAVALLAVHESSVAVPTPAEDKNAPAVLHPSITQAVLFYALVLAVAALDGYLLIAAGDTRLVAGVVLGSVVLTGLILLRQFLAIVENAELSRHLEIKNTDLARANLRLEALATTDQLTDLLNSRGMGAALDAEVERSRRYNRRFSVLFMDIDHFKQVNDDLGHAAGDQALRQFAMMAHRLLRTVDSIGRWGGEEFVAILPETDAEGSIRSGERFRSGIADAVFPGLSDLRLTCSIGVATCPDDAEDADGLIAVADGAMYAAKRLGRNQVRTKDDVSGCARGVARGRRLSPTDIGAVATVEALGALVDARDHYTGDHTTEVALLSRRIGISMGLSREDVRTIEMAARLHDIGKVAVADAILLNPGRLSPEEWTLIGHHPVVGSDVLSQIPSLDALAPIVRFHHENFGGGGYPDGLSGDDIPIGARIVSVADAFAAMTSDRPYPSGMTEAEALNEVRRCAGYQFDPTVVEFLCRLVAAQEGMVA